MNSLTLWAQAHPWPAAGTAVLLLAAAVWAARAGRKAARRTPAAVLVAALAAMACTAYSADTSWRFAAHRLDMAGTAERIGMFAAAELALFATALMARQNLRTQGAPGTPGMLVWLITGVQVIPAFAESGIVGGTVRAVVGPVLAALLWHLAMGIELRHAKPGADSGSLPALLAREVRERLLSRLGLAVRDRTAEQITRDRATVKAVALAAKLADMKSGARGRARVARRLSVAVGKAQAGADAEQRAKLLELLAARRHAASLATIDLASPWQAPVAVVEETEPVPAARPLPKVVPAGVRLLPVVAREVVTKPADPTFRFDHGRQRWVPAEPATDDQPQPLPEPPKVVIPQTVRPPWKDTATAVHDPFDIHPWAKSAVPAEAPRQVVTEVIALTPSELLKRAHKLNRDLVRTTTRPVTIARLQDEFGLSRRDATELRRQVVTPKGDDRS
ncbi:hypothetical protein ACFYNZ_15235 [Streptomyces kebangsaanensis]|uniref:DUF2637 domain-containing protein n=1 Tax=Streptomyces kebangsaanensis TaxID=864058 RepID=A0ABW6KST4_9ACTN